MSMSDPGNATGSWPRNTGSPDSRRSEIGRKTVARFAYVGSETRQQAPARLSDAEAAGITVYTVDPVSGALDLVQTVPSVAPFFFAFDSARLHLYAVNVVDTYEGAASGSVEAYARDPESGRLTFINRVASGGAIPAQPAISPSGRWLLIANYGGANVTVLPIGQDGSLGEVVAEARRTGSGPNTDRQDQSRPHAVVFDPAGRFAAVADLGNDGVATYALREETGELTLVSEVRSRPGAGPRHLVFDRDGTRIYVTNELDATIDLFSFDPATGTIGANLQTVSTVPEGFMGTRSTAEILIDSAGRFLYNSNRGQPDTVTPEGDAIVGWAVDAATGLLTLAGYTTDGIGQPWNFAFDTSGSALYVANFTASTVTHYRIDQRTGMLARTGNDVNVPFPYVIALVP